MIESGMRAGKVAEILDRSEYTASIFLKRYQETENIENKHRSGRPKLITERGAWKLSKIVKTDRKQSLRDITHEFNASNVQPFSTRTIQRIAFFGL
jgi:transposase